MNMNMNMHLILSWRQYIFDLNCLVRGSDGPGNVDRATMQRLRHDLTSDYDL